ncbi:MAG TPA: DNA recombination protein RmuC [Gaiellaceae bacterium]|nr:DNA recombination protein RmuC [Gaiellaceae bacterium]
MVIVALLIGLAVGAFAVLAAVRPALVERRRRTQDVIALERELATVGARLELAEETANERLQAAVKSASLEAYAQTNTALVELAATKLEGTVKPLEESLRAVGNRVQELDRARAKGYGELSRHLTDLGEQTASLRNALRTPHARGRWGEIQLKRVVEIAGMLPYCDFAEQVTATTDDGRLRPDLIVRLPGAKQVVVDAKVPLSAYLDAQETSDEDLRRQHLENHARQVRDHLSKLAAKSYWQQFADSPEWVVMFLPDEGFFRAAWEHDASLVETGVRSRVHIASPTTLIVLLQAIAHGWQQEKVAEDARIVHALGRELYERMTVAVGTHFAKLGTTLDKAVGAYNEAVGSLERRVLPTARKLGQTTLSDRELPELEPRSTHTVPLQAPELAPDERVLLAILAGEADANVDAA